jgi:hypothetical protein
VKLLKKILNVGVARGGKKGEVPDQELELMNNERDWIVSK